jgi:hypothetical protein
MATFYDSISDSLREFIEAQHLFFVASAPLDAEGHVNLSPKGYDGFRVLSPNRVAYLDLTGSGNETSAHLMENGRITFMFCAFDNPANIVRLFGKGQTILPDTPEWDDLMPHFEAHPSARQIIVAEIDKVQTSCGYGVPFFEYVGERPTLDKWAENKGPAGLVAYRAEKNVRSLDGLPTPLAQTIRE